MKKLSFKQIKNIMLAILAALFVTCIGLAFKIMPTAYAAVNPEMTVQVSQESAMAGETVRVTISLKDNPGVASIKLNVAYENFLTLQNIEYNSSLGGQTSSSNYQIDGSPATLIWVNAFENFTQNEVFATLTFKIADDTESDSFSEITVTYNPADIYNAEETDINLTVINGSVYVESCKAGDINGDGSVNNKDITRLFQYLANWNVTVNEDALDVNGDGSVNNKDITRLFQYLANWDVKVYVRKPCIVTFNGNGGTLVSGKESQAVRRGGSAVAPVYEKEGFSFDGFDVDYTNVTRDLIVTAKWKENDKKLETPVISKIEYDTIYWSPVDNADYYTVRVNDNYECTLRGTSCSLSAVKWSGNAISDYGYVSVKIMANQNGDYLSSDWSAVNNSYFYVPEVKSNTTDTLIKYSIGFGYNLIEDEYLDITKCSNISVFNVGKLLTIGNYTARPHSGGTGTSYYYRSIDEFISKTKVSVEYGQTTGCVLLGSIKMQINVDLGFDYRSYKFNETYIYEYNWTYKDHIITNFASDNLLMYCLSDSFLKDIKRESSATAGMNDNQLCAYIYDTYGTHAILGITTGGTYIADYIISTNDTDIAASVDVAFNLSTGGGGAIDLIIQKDFNIGIDVSENLSWKNSTTEAHYTTHIYGGSGGGSTTASGVDAAIKTWTNSLSEDNARSVKFTENGAIALSNLISYIDSSFAQKFANYINSKADAAYHELFDQYTMPTTLPMSINTENGQNVLRVDLSSYQSAGTLGDAYSPNLLNNVLTVYPVMFGKDIDKIVVIGAFDENRTLIDSFSLALSSQWKRPVDIEFENCGFVCASENGLVDDSKVNFNANVLYKGVNCIKDKQGNTVLHATINDKVYDFVFLPTEGATIDLSTIRISSGELTLAYIEKENYTFMGWKDSNNVFVTDKYGKILNSYVLADNTVNLHADFTPVTYEITLNSQSAYNAGTTKVYERFGDNLYFDENCENEIEYIVVPQKTGYDFKGYYLSIENNATANAQGTGKYIDEYGNFVGFDSTTFTEKTTLYALWQPATFTITLDNGYGVENSVITSTYNVGVSTENVSVPEKAGYIFRGYYVSVTDNNTEQAVGTTKVINENGKILFNNTFVIENNTVFYALWLKIELTFALNTDHTAYTVTGYNGTATEVYVPAEYDGLPVTAIGDNAFKNKTEITNIEIPNSITNIENHAFEGCSKLSNINISDSVTSIGIQAFYNCSSLTSVIIPDSVTSIGQSAFSGCTSLKNITIPDSVTSIGKYAFNNCTCEIKWGENPSITTIGNCAFFKYKGTNITIPNSVTSIGDDAFEYCSNLTSIVIPDGVMTIGYDVFCGCSSLTSVTIPNSVTSIGSSMFSGCSSLSEITIPDSVTSIGYKAFYNCSSLTSITIPDRVTSIGSSAIEGCSGLTSVYYTGDIAGWCNISFITENSNPLYYVHNLYIDNTLVTNLVIPNTVTKIKDYAFYGCSSLTSITIPDSVTSIGYESFYNCSSLTSITIPDSVTSMSGSDFGGCSSLENITIPFIGPDAKGLATFGFIFGSKSYNGGTATQVFQEVSTNSNVYYYIPNSLKSVIVTGGAIPNGAFYNCSGLTSLTIGDGVTTIGQYAFYGCRGLTSVMLGNRVTNIGKYAFQSCSSLMSITIPNTVTSIGDYAFESCYKLFEIINNSSLNIQRGSNNYGKIGLYALSIHSGASKIVNVNDYLFITNDNGINYLIGYIGEETELTLPNDYNGQSYKIYRYAFYRCSIITSVTISNNVTYIHYSAFEYCTNLRTINISNSVTNIERGAFEHCSSLATIIVQSGNAKYHSQGNCLIETASKTLVLGCQYSVIPSDDSVTSIGDYAFYNCSALFSITIPDSVTSIGAYAFKNCSDLSSITISDSVINIGDYAFDYCSSLTSVTIPEDITVIGEYAFRNCSSLATVNWNAINCTSVGSSSHKIFDGCSNLKIVNIGDKVTIIPTYAFYQCGSLISITIPDSVTNIGDYAFYYCINLTSVTIGGSVMSIGRSAFYGCNSLMSVTFSDTTTWYRTTSSTNWQNKTGGTETNVTNNLTNATFFKDTYKSYYWYKV